jgi:hypothetical protein
VPICASKTEKPSPQLLCQQRLAETCGIGDDKDGVFGFSATISGKDVSREEAEKVLEELKAAKEKYTLLKMPEMKGTFEFSQVEETSDE